MARYIGMRIMGGHMEYAVVVPKYPQFKEGIDKYLTDRGAEHLIVEV